MTTEEKVTFLIEGFNNFHNAIAFSSTNNSHIPFRVIITTHDHNASSHTIKIDDSNEINEILHHFEKELSKIIIKILTKDNGKELTLPNVV